MNESHDRKHTRWSPPQMPRHQPPQEPFPAIIIYVIIVVLVLSSILAATGLINLVLNI